MAPRKASQVASHATSPTALQLETWRLLWEEFTADGWAATELRAWEDRRVHVQPRMLDLLERFIAGSVSVADFRSAFDSHTRTDWDMLACGGRPEPCS